MENPVNGRSPLQSFVLILLTAVSSWFVESAIAAQVASHLPQSEVRFSESLRDWLVDSYPYTLPNTLSDIWEHVSVSLEAQVPGCVEVNVETRAIVVGLDCLTEIDRDHIRLRRWELIPTKFISALYSAHLSIWAKKSSLFKHPLVLRFLENSGKKTDDASVLQFWIENTLAYIRYPDYWQGHREIFGLLREHFFDYETYGSTAPLHMRIHPTDYVTSRVYEMYHYCETMHQKPVIELMVATSGSREGMLGHSMLRIRDCDVNDENDLVFSFAGVPQQSDGFLDVVSDAVNDRIPLTLVAFELNTAKHIYNMLEDRTLKRYEISYKQEKIWDLIFYLQMRYSDLFDYRHNGEKYSLLSKNCTTEIRDILEKAFGIKVETGLVTGRVPLFFDDALRNDSLLADTSLESYLSKTKKWDQVSSQMEDLLDEAREKLEPGKKKSLKPVYEILSNEPEKRLGAIRLINQKLIQGRPATEQEKIYYHLLLSLKILIVQNEPDLGNRLVSSEDLITLLKFRRQGLI